MQKCMCVFHKCDLVEKMYVTQDKKTNAKKQTVTWEMKNVIKKNKEKVIHIVSSRSKKNELKTIKS